MTPLAIGLLLIGLLGVLVLLGMPITLALISLAFLGLYLIRGDIGLAAELIATSAFTGVAEYLFVVIPSFVLMGMLVHVCGIGRDTFEVAQALLRRLKGGLGIATVAANALFAAVTGISVASATVFTQIAVPQMLRFGYTAKFAAGTVAGSSILGMLIPPSLVMIVYGVLAEVSIGKLFIAGVMPGIVMSVAFILLIIGMAVLRPGSVYTNPEIGVIDDNVASLSTRQLAAKIVPISVLIVFVLGGLYTGYFTATEAGATGALGAFIIALYRRAINFKSLWAVLTETGYVSVGILCLLISAAIYSRMLTVAGIPTAIADAVAQLGLGKWGFIVAYTLLIVALGCILDSISIMLIVVPIAVPIATKFGMDPVQFGILTVIAVETGLLTPPFGLSVFAVRSALPDRAIKLETIFAGALPYVAVMLAVLVLVAVFPSLSLWLVARLS
jgi:tripartite ATP-independent transporter DctM subunit